jgi:hypothetical protein
MNEINKEEMFGNLKSFLKAKGIELQEGAYTRRIQKGCEILTDSVNLSQRTFDRAKTAMDKGLEQLKLAVHERTAPKSETRTGQNKSRAQNRAKKKPMNAKSQAAAARPRNKPRR